jgi:hypothetical protein
MLPDVVAVLRDRLGETSAASAAIRVRRVVTVHATLLTIVMTSPPKVSTPTIVAAPARVTLGTP